MILLLFLVAQLSGVIAIAFQDSELRHRAYMVANLIS